MPEKISHAAARLGAAIKEFTIAQRTLTLVGLGVMAAIVIGLYAWSSRPTYAPLYTGLAATDASAVVEQLEASGVSYQLADGGATVMVPKDSVYQMRLKTAAAGLPAASDGGYSLLDEMGMGSSEFQQSTTYKRAMEGELAKTISAMKGVETASVQLALPEDTVFVAEKADPTASVFVGLRTGQTLDDDQVQAIVHLVSASIENMKPTDVAVIDSTGKVLSAVGVGAAGSGSGKQNREYEERIVSSVQTMLDRIVGPGNAVVSVTADLDFDQVQRTEERFESNKDVQPLTESRTSETYTGGGPNTTSGVLGPDNIAVPTGENEDGEYANESETKTNAVDKITQVTEAAPGTVRRQSVSVAVDQNAAAALSMAELESLVASAAGVDEERGDVVTVSRMAFDSSNASAAQAALAAEREAAAKAERAALIRTAVMAGLGVVLVIALAVVVARSRKSKGDERTALDIGDLEPLPVAPVDPTALALDMVEETEQTLAMIAPVDELQLDAEAKRNEVGNMADSDPAEIADRLRSMMDVGARK
ncbi:flagellar M-ring protein FliF [Flavimobilis soli]|uniref:Flagellar M-ring protein n=1 Tax=Flavimobilis soli TaxID=442709 RepID=A0A2A9EGM6_9MICO|nr:flagellar basal-body MS-ring/collar protein FliF [Flavimobilis soli]PFG37415.1 flagellar M-ring protein FliF [Flavimobilis soli]